MLAFDTMPLWPVALAVVAGVVTGLLLIHKEHTSEQKRENAAKAFNSNAANQSTILYNVELPDPEIGDELHLCCPYCQFTGLLERQELVGKQVDCPCCERPIHVLEPENELV